MHGQRPEKKDVRFIFPMPYSLETRSLIEPESHHFKQTDKPVSSRDLPLSGPDTRVSNTHRYLGAENSNLALDHEHLSTGETPQPPSKSF